MEFKEWDLFKFNNQLYVVDKCQDDKIYSKKNPHNKHVICHKSSVQKITKVTIEYLDSIKENLHPDLCDLFLDKL